MIINTPLDMHLHLRDEQTLDYVAAFSSKDFAAAVIMPNLIPPICDKKALLAYKSRVLKACKDQAFTPLMTLFYQNYDQEFLKDIKDDIFAIKLYPAGITTNSQNGLASFDIKAMRQTLECMSELGLALLVHGESNDFVMDREANFAPIYESLATNFPKLKIVMEHITTAKLASLLDKYDNLYATITLHHLFITLDDVIGGALNPHLFCKPIAKREKDKQALLDLALNAHPRVMFGSDSAPHTKQAKLECGCAGVFSAPVCLPMLAKLFSEHSKLEKLQAFISTNAINAHKLKIEQKLVKLVEKEWTVPKSYGAFTPFMSEQKMSFMVE